MKRRFALVSARAGEDWHAARLQRALEEHGETEVLDPASLRLHCRGAAGLLLLAGEGDARRFDAVVLGRIAGPGADADLQLDGARAFELVGVPVLNRVGPMLVAQDKLWTAALLTRAGLPTPPCASLPRPADVGPGVSALGRAVAKPIFGSLGEGSFKVDDARARARLRARLREEPYLVQAWVPSAGVDFRLFVVGGRVEACIRREASPGEWRSNAGRGARVLSCVARPQWRELAVSATQVLGLDFAGVDLALDGEGRPTVLEVNGFPSFRAVLLATGRDMARPIAALAAKRARARPRWTGRAGAGASPA